MKKGILAVAVSSALFLLATPVSAAGPYAGVEGGVVWLSDSKGYEDGIYTGSSSFECGWGIGAAGGYDFGAFRGELELAYRQSCFKNITYPVSGSDPLGGDITSTALMVNAYYDFRMISPHVIPYLGAGIGGAYVSEDLNWHGINAVDESDTVFAYQFIGGVAFPLSKQLTVDLNYRYFATTDPSFPHGGGRLEVEYGGSNLLLGLRYNF